MIIKVMQKKDALYFIVPKLFPEIFLLVNHHDCVVAGILSQQWRSPRCLILLTAFLLDLVLVLIFSVGLLSFWQHSLILRRGPVQTGLDTVP